MTLFKDQEDLKEWLDNLDYQSFWQEIAIFDLPIMTKDHVDSEIAKGHVDQETALYVMKGFARLEMIEKYSIPLRDDAPWYSMH